MRLVCIHAEHAFWPSVAVASSHRPILAAVERVRVVTTPVCKTKNPTDPRALLNKVEQGIFDLIAMKEAARMSAEIILAAVEAARFGIAGRRGCQQRQ